MSATARPHSWRVLLAGALAATGLVLFLWPALRAPVVVWSDSVIDMNWARSGEGILSPAVSKDRPAKPGYLLFLRIAMALGPMESAPRRIVVLQSVLLWLGIAGASALVGRRRGLRWGVALYVLLVSFLRLRDAASAVMSEAVTVAIALPIAGWLLDPPLTRRGRALLGAAIAALFLVRPNCGGVLLLLAVASYAALRRGRQLAVVAAAFALVFLPFWIATSQDADRLRGLASPLFIGSREYSWPPSGVGLPETSSLERQAATARWKTAFSGSGADNRRELLWRAFHGLLGIEYSDSRWSPVYSWFSNASRALSPLLVLLAAAVIFWAPRDPATPARLLGAFLVALAVAQSFVFGGFPRFGLPLLPLVLLYGLVCFEALRRTAPWRPLAAGATFALLVVAVGSQPQLLDREWGLIEAPGIRLTQRIPRKALPAAGPATLHIRIGPLLTPTGAHIDVRFGDTLLYTSAGDPRWGEAAIRVALPESLLLENQRRAVKLDLASIGAYGPSQFVLFPAIPRFWSAPAERPGDAALSPGTGISSGALDWWAHSGHD